MAAPTVSTRTIPVGFKMADGFKTLISFLSNTGIQFWEIAVKPPGFDGGDPIPTTTMHNILYRTFDTKRLKTLTECTVTAFYDPDCYPGILALINAPTSITVLFPDGSKLVFYGYLKKFEVNEHKEGESPEATLSIQPTNWDSTNFVEAAPVFTAARTGTRSAD